jgi:hypothetical protein
LLQCFARRIQLGAALYPNAAGLQVDQNMIRSDGTLDTSVGIGNGTWNCAFYRGVAHFARAGKNFPPRECASAATINSVYNYEMNFLADRSLGGETGGPQCAPPEKPIAVSS